MVNVVLSPATTNADTRGGVGTKTDYGSDNTETIDGNDASYYGQQRVHSGDGSANVYCQSEHTWNTSHRIEKLYVKMWAQSGPVGNYVSKDIDFEISLKIGGTWTKIVDLHYDPTSSSAQNEEYDEELTTGWDDVTGIRAYVYSYGYSYEGLGSQTVIARIYEVQAYYTPDRSYCGVL